MRMGAGLIAIPLVQITSIACNADDGDMVDVGSPAQKIKSLTLLG